MAAAAAESAEKPRKLPWHSQAGGCQPGQAGVGAPASTGSTSSGLPTTPFPSPAATQRTEEHSLRLQDIPAGHSQFELK